MAIVCDTLMIATLRSLMQTDMLGANGKDGAVPCVCWMGEEVASSRWTPILQSRDPPIITTARRLPEPFRPSICPWLSWTLSRL